MPNSTSRPALRLAALLPLAVGALAIPATSAPAHAATPSAPTGVTVPTPPAPSTPSTPSTPTSPSGTGTSGSGSSASSAPAQPTAAERRAAARREARRHRREVRRHKRMMRMKKTMHAFKIGTHQKGDPYSYGASGPGAFDCSGLTSYAYKKAGLSLPRTSSAQAGAVRHIPRSKLHKGDLIFFTDGGSVYHVGLFAGRHDGGTYVLHAPYSGTDVRVDRIWTNSWFAGTKR